MKILVIGENLVDLFKNGEIFEAHVGGSPLNVAVGLSRLSNEVTYLTKFSTDFFSTKIIKTLESEKISLSLCPRSELLHTTLSFAFLNENGVPSFEIWNKMTADGDLKWEEIANVDVTGFEVVHFGSILLSTPAAEPVLKLVETFKKSKKLVFFDPNYRPKVAMDEENYLYNLKRSWEIADVVKCSEDDLKALFNVDFKVAMEEISKSKKPVFVTCGEKGVYVVRDGKIKHLPAYKIDVVDTTGCGDAFMAGLIHKLKGFEWKSMIEAAQFGEAVATLVARKRGALTSLPLQKEVEEFLKGGSNCV